MWCVPHVYLPDMQRHSDKNGRIKSIMQLNTHLGNFVASKGYLGTSWVILLLSWVILGSSSGQPGIILRSFWDHFRSSCGHLWLFSRNFQLSCGHPRYPSLGCPEIIVKKSWQKKTFFCTPLIQHGSILWGLWQKLMNHFCLNSLYVLNVTCYIHVCNK